MRRRRFLDQLELVARAQAGDRGAVEDLLVEMEGMVRAWAGKIFRQFSSLEYEDLVQIGRMGILDAICTFDPTRGARFSTHLGWRLRHQRTIARREDGLIRLPEHVTGTAAGRARWPEPPRVTRSLDEPVQTQTGGIGEENILFGDTLVAEEDTEAAALLALGEEWVAVREAVRHLPEREREVLTLRFGLGDGRGRTLDECGEILGLTREGVRQREKTALRHLRRNLKGTG